MKAIWQGDRLKIRRKQLGMTMEELAVLVGTKRSHISMWEDSKIVPSGNFIVLFGIVLRCRPKQFFVIEE